MNRPLRGLSALVTDWAEGLLALAVLLAIASCPAHAQRKPVYQDGVILPNHLTKQTTTGLIKDSGAPATGDAQGKGISPIGINDNKSPLGVCSYSDDPTKPSSYVCLGHDTAGAPTISVGSVYGAAPQGINFNLNGAALAWPGAGGGNVIGPITPYPAAVLLACWNGSTSLVGCGTAPTSLGLIFNSGWAGMGSANYTGNQDMARITVNDFPLVDEFGGGVYAITSGLVVGMVVPSNSITNAIDAADQVFIAYGKTLSPIKGVAAVTGQSFMGAAGSNAWGLVGNVINCKDVICTGGGFGGGAVLFSAEFDMNLVPKAGNVAPDITAIGLHIANNSTTNVAAGHLHTGINFTSTYEAYPWAEGITFQIGSTATAILISAAASGNSQASQLMKFVSTSSAGVSQVTPIVSTALGSLQVTLPTATAFLEVIGGGIAVTQPTNGNLTTLYLRRATDTAPTGDLIQGINAASNATLFSVDVVGNAAFSGYSISGGAAGASCPAGVVAATVVVAGGIITHC